MSFSLCLQKIEIFYTTAFFVSCGGGEWGTGCNSYRIEFAPM